jgi:hypothetical protein
MYAARHMQGRGDPLPLAAPPPCLSPARRRRSPRHRPLCRSAAAHPPQSCWCSDPIESERGTCRRERCGKRDRKNINADKGSWTSPCYSNLDHAPRTTLPLISKPVNSQELVVSGPRSCRWLVSVHRFDSTPVGGSAARRCPPNAPPATLLCASPELSELTSLRKGAAGRPPEINVSGSLGDCQPVRNELASLPAQYRGPFEAVSQLHPLLGIRGWLQPSVSSNRSWESTIDARLPGDGTAAWRIDSCPASWHCTWETRKLERKEKKSV